MGIRNMQGTSAYLEYIGPKGRKYKKDCIYNKDNVCICDKSGIYLSKCAGRTICGFYEDSEEARKKFLEKKVDIFSIFDEVIKVNKKHKESNNKKTKFEKEIKKRK